MFDGEAISATIVVINYRLTVIKQMTLKASHYFPLPRSGVVRSLRSRWCTKVMCQLSEFSANETVAEDRFSQDPSSHV